MGSQRKHKSGRRILSKREVINNVGIENDLEWYNLECKCIGLQNTCLLIGFRLETKFNVFFYRRWGLWIFIAHLCTMIYNGNYATINGQNPFSLVASDMFSKGMKVHCSISPYSTGIHPSHPIAFLSLYNIIDVHHVSCHGSAPTSPCSRPVATQASRIAEEAFCKQLTGKMSDAYEREQYVIS